MIINVYRLDSSQEEPEYSLIGHEHNVCALHTASDGTIISGSWDRYVIGESYRSTLLNSGSTVQQKSGRTSSWHMI